jgi:hypothetical protein
MTVPACLRCNGDYSQDEMRVAAIIGTVSFSEADRIAVAPGGWIQRAMERDHNLHTFIASRLDGNGLFHIDNPVLDAMWRVMGKTAVGLLFHEFGRIVRPSDMTLLGVEHSKNIHPSAFAEMHRREGLAFAEVTPSGRELERQVVALYSGEEPPHMPPWREYIAEYFGYMFLRRSNNRLLAALKLHNALTIVLECPWPSRAGPRRKGRPPTVTG